MHQNIVVTKGTLQLTTTLFNYIRIESSHSKHFFRPCNKNVTHMCNTENGTIYL